MSKTIRIYGASDDLVEIEGDIAGADEYGVGQSGHWRGIIEAPDGHTAFLYVDYRQVGTWTATLGQYEEGYAMPPWPSTLTVDMDACDYSVLLTLEVPDGTIVREYEETSR